LQEEALKREAERQVEEAERRAERGTPTPWQWNAKWKRAKPRKRPDKKRQHASKPTKQNASERQKTHGWLKVARQQQQLGVLTLVEGTQEGARRKAEEAERLAQEARVRQQLGALTWWRGHLNMKPNGNSAKRWNSAPKAQRQEMEVLKLLEAARQRDVERRQRAEAERRAEEERRLAAAQEEQLAQEQQRSAEPEQRADDHADCGIRRFRNRIHFAARTRRK